MSGQDHIETKIKEMVSLTGNSIVTMTVYDLTINHLGDLDRLGERLDRIVTKASVLSRHTSKWANESGRVEVATNAFPQDDDISWFLVDVIGKMDQAYKKAFRKDGAIDYLKRVASTAERLHRTLVEKQ